MSPSPVVFLCLFASALAAPQPADNAVVDALTDAAIDVKQAVGVPVITAVSDLCPAVTAIVYPIETLGKAPDVDDMTVVFKHQDGTNDTYNITDAAEEIPNSSYFDSSQIVYLYIPGWTDNPNKTSFATVSDALLSAGHTNVLALDTSTLVASLYLRSTGNVRFIAEKLAEVLVALLNYGVTASQIHIIGHSLGGQMAGLTGKHFYNKTNEKIGRITGLDPAGPCYTDVSDDLKLNTTDAAFVDVIHTDAGVAGLNENVGQVDFYPNSGANQPGCSLDDSCSHSRAWKYFAESVRNESAFPSVQCDSWSDFKKGKCSTDIVYMGFPAKSGTTGVYYLQTNGTSPYSLGVQGTVYKDY